VSALVGREPELAAIEGVLAAGDGLRVLELAGEPGIGKTTLWQEALARARSDGLRVLAAQPAESEAKLAFAGLTDLLADVEPELFSTLPPPQRHALDVALLRVEAGRAPSRRLVGTALLSLLRGLTAGGPALLAVDDAQWLDRASAAALEFAVRRLSDVPLRLVVSTRADAVRPGLVTVVADERVRRLEVGPLSVAALQRIIAARLGVSLPRPALVRIAEASRGNAFYALEIARELVQRDEQAWTPLPVPADLRTLVARRIASLPAATRDALLRAAALARPAYDLVDVRALAPAESAGLVAVDRAGQIAFTHPLFAAAVYGTATSDDRAAVHRALSTSVRDEEERARHLALATATPDAEVARVLDEAARGAHARGAPDAAAELIELALQLTEDADEADERRLALADYLFLASDFPRAAAVLEDVVERRADELHGRALLALADIDYWRSGESVAVAQAERALANIRDPLLQARCHASIAMWAGTSDLVRASEAARAALALLDGRADADPALVALALGARIRADLFLGNGFDREAAERALALEAPAPPAAVDTRLVFKLGQWLRYVDDFDGARSRLALAERAAVDEGDDSSLANILLNRTLLECWAGNWELAAELGDRAHEQFRLTGVDVGASNLWRAYVDAHFGRADAVHDTAERAGDAGEPVVQMLWNRTLALADLAVGEFASASDRFADALDVHARIGMREPAVWRIAGDAVEAAVGAGDLARARVALLLLGGGSRVPWSLAVAARSRALVLAAEGDAASAAAELDRALAEHDACPMPFELARTLLAAGQVQRRLKQKRRARDLLDRAAELFDALGAEPWAARARDESLRTATRTAPDDLTPTELRIAKLAAAGLTNDAIAAEVFVSRKTVEANLGRAYRKLEIRGRAQLARALDARERETIP
jgi:DNA-binding CsgD family transcriptional regulator